MVDSTPSLRDEAVLQPVLSLKRKASGDLKKDLSDNASLMPVYLRVRPTADEDRYVNVLSETEVEITGGSRAERGRLKALKAERYAFSHVFKETATQKEVYDSVVGPMVDEIFSPGESSALLMAYGASSSGKTFTTKGTPDQPGILLRTIETILNRVKGAPTKLGIKPVRWNDIQTTTGTMPRKISIAPNEGVRYEYAIYLSFAEIYIEQVYDLQNATAEAVNADSNDRIFRKVSETASKRPIAQLKEDVEGRKYINGQVEVRIKDMDHARQVVEDVMRNRSVLSTRMNEASSRSHLLSVVKVLRIPVADGTSKIAGTEISRVAVVDLAGAERIGQSGVEGKAHRETKNINKSLHTLAMCIEGMRENQSRTAKKVVIPWRESKLTMLIQPYFEHGQVGFIVNVNPSMQHFRVTSEVFRFAQRAGALHAGVNGKAEANDVDPDPAMSILNAELLQQVSSLRQQLRETECRLVEQELAVRQDCAREMSKRLQEMELKHRERRKQAERHEQEKLDRKLDMANAMHKDKIDKLQRRLAEQSRLIEEQERQLHDVAVENGESGVLQRQISYLSKELELRTSALEVERDTVIKLRQRIREMEMSNGLGEKLPLSGSSEVLGEKIRNLEDQLARTIEEGIAAKEAAKVVQEMYQQKIAQLSDQLVIQEGKARKLELDFWELKRMEERHDANSVNETTEILPSEESMQDLDDQSITVENTTSHPLSASHETTSKRRILRYSTEYLEAKAAEEHATSDGSVSKGSTPEVMILPGHGSKNAKKRHSAVPPRRRISRTKEKRLSEPAMGTLHSTREKKRKAARDTTDGTFEAEGLEAQEPSFPETIVEDVTLGDENRHTYVKQSVGRKKKVDGPLVKESQSGNEDMDATVESVAAEVNSSPTYEAQIDQPITSSPSSDHILKPQNVEENQASMTRDPSGIDDDNKSKPEEPIKKKRKLRSKKIVDLQEIEAPVGRSGKRYSTIVQRLPKRG
ncbi:uncharacterized protein SPPG_00269 [Spizellomyces punctatus DAOM BR117]|uniref:Kinesin-like protein n=1 Tax=Spizellomyces punctatus (strain DAOM BR117) TaxID=645134 RepID=A0A0L0HUJ6_SPIPD|nr:uncharacterized protein SPPG_00269 [Spizellomyces punctatus DAOM BR117]KND04544.1 hypothetical protein SPPG_00269 [Spizellomyces punctatus DAOM BR117]|eukprot:XP_016612583.1 hypothetical protein SPPG_00269 [Spizellomyces punctatus DAOM BR117]